MGLDSANTIGCSLSFAKQLQEGKRQIQSTLRFADGKQTLDEKNLVTGTSKHQEAPIPPCVTDLMSAIFYGGSQALQPGASFRMPLADAMRVVDVTMKALRKAVTAPSPGGRARSTAHRRACR